MSTNPDFQASEADCCGNGCSNCILDTIPTKITKTNLQDKVNILLCYRPYQLLERLEIKGNILQMHFKCIRGTADADSILYVPPGHHVMMQAPNNEASNSKTEAVASSYVTRPYSPFWSDVEQLEFKILVNIAPNGFMSKYIQQLSVGDEVFFRGPVGSFRHNPKSYGNVLLFCHGVAIAPILAIIKDILNDDEDVTRIKLFACFENLEKILFRDELHELNGYWNFRSRIYLSRPEEDFHKKLKYKENVVGGRLNGEELRTILTEFKDLQSIKCVICGSKPFQENLKQMLLERGLEENAVDIL
ncbi:unnamed protein product [Hermetia illucens]|uniref:FAD-binding FR-type domain-containing protein n=1 Tax=Hermetia illucens TaxID=343691 RepID=A0A7R8UVM4_HERIL|nr:NADH-cytochrome b5 reductase-like [Hermetia illucens]CAD7087449.1 unnamed protein product [Hermetia illucens]